MLGTDRYAAFISIQALLSWTGLLSFGLIPTLPKFIAEARASGDKEKMRNFVIWPLLLLLAIAVALAAALILLGLVVPARQMLSASEHIDPERLRNAYFVAVILQSLLLLTAAEAAIRSGYQEVHRTGLISAAANVISIGLLLLYGPHAWLIGFMLILYAPLPLLLLADIGALFHGQRYLFGRPTQLAETIRSLASHSGNALAVQIAFFLFAYLPPLAVAHLRDPIATAAFGTLMQLSIMGANAFNLVFQPLLSAIADARGHNHWVWIRQNYLRGLALVGAVGAVGIVLLATVGPWIIDLWLKKDIGITRALCATFGVYFLLMTNALYHFYVLSGIGVLQGLGRVYILQGFLAIGLGCLLCIAFGATGMAAGLALGLLALTSWYGPIRMRNILAANISAEKGD